jgi:hypothetical protein
MPPPGFGGPPGGGPPGMPPPGMPPPGMAPPGMPPPGFGGGMPPGMPPPGMYSMWAHSLLSTYPLIACAPARLLYSSRHLALASSICSACCVLCTFACKLSRRGVFRLLICHLRVHVLGGWGVASVCMQGCRRISEVRRVCRHLHAWVDEDTHTLTQHTNTRVCNTIPFCQFASLTGVQLPCAPARSTLQRAPSGAPHRASGAAQHRATSVEER